MANVFSVIRYLMGHPITTTADNTHIGSDTFQGETIFTDTAGTGAGVLKSIQAQAITAKATLPTTAGATGGGANLTAAAGAAATGTTAGGPGGAATVTGGAGGAKTTTGAAVGGAGGAVNNTAGVGGATASSSANAGGVGGSVNNTAGAGGAASAGTGNGGEGGSVINTVGAGGASAGGTAGVPGVIFNRGTFSKKISAPAAKTGVATLSAADILGGLITLNQTTSGTVALTTCTGTELAAALPAGFTVGDSIDFTIINLDTTAAANTGTLTAGASGITIVGPVVIPSAHSTTIATSARTYRARNTTGNTFIIYAV